MAADRRRSVRPSTKRATPIRAGEHRLLAPVVPSKIVAIGLNYKDHAAEMNKPLPAEPLMFIKPSTAVIGPDDPDRASGGRRPRRSRGGGGRRDRRRASARAASTRRTEYIFGLTCVNDVTGARAAEEGRPVHARQGLRHLRAGRARASRSGSITRHRRASTSRAGSTATRRQSSSTRAADFPDRPSSIAFISSVMTLLPGDIISTGTPSGIGPLAGRRSCHDQGCRESAS